MRAGGESSLAGKGARERESERGRQHGVVGPALSAFLSQYLHC